MTDQIVMPGISAALGMTPLVIEGERQAVTVPAAVPPQAEAQPDLALENDFDEARKNLHNIAKKGQEVLNTLIVVAQSSEEPRAYEVLATLIKTLSDTNAALIDIHTKKKKAKTIAAPAQEQQAGKAVTNNNVFVGTTAEFMRMMHGNSDDTEL